jgi:hypothetical protein
MNEDHLITCLKSLCQRFSTEALDGRFEVAKTAGLSEQYLYQILTGKPMANGNKRSLGKQAREKITAKYPDWLGLATQPTYQSAAAIAQEPPKHFRPLVQAVCDFAEQINDDGLRELVGFARCLAGTHPLVKQKAA